MLTAMVRGYGLTTSSGSLKFTACPPSSNCAVKGGMVIAASIALLLNATAYCVNGITLMSTSLMVSPVALQQLADFIGRHRALAVGGDGLAPELPQLRDFALEVGTQHQVVPERARDAVQHHRDRQVLFQRVEIAGGNSPLHELQLVLRQQRDRVGGGVERLGHDLDAVVFEVTLLDRPQNRGGGDRAHRADLDGNLLAVSRARTADDGETRKQGALNRHAISPVECVIALFGCDEIAFLAVAIETFLPELVERKHDLPPIAAFACVFSTMPIAVMPIRPVRGTVNYSAKRCLDHKRRPRPIGNGVRAWIG